MIKRIFVSSAITIQLFAGSYDNGIGFYKKAQYKKAIESFEIASNNNDNRAMLAIGIIYANGDGVKWDPIKSFDWFKKAANAGNKHAYLKLGNLFASQENYKKAYPWFLKSANTGNSEAAYKLGYFYTGGLGVKTDLKKALQWYEKAAISGNINAQLNLGFAYIGGLGTKVNYKKAAFWIHKAKDTGSEKAIELWKEFKLEEHYKN